MYVHLAAQETQTFGTMTNTARSPSPDTALTTELIDCVAGVNGREGRGNESGD